MVDTDRSRETEGIGPSFEFVLKAQRPRKRSNPDPNLIFPTARQLKRFGGKLVRPHGRLVLWEDYRLQVTPLGAGLIDFTALTAALINDKRTFRSGDLIEYGSSLATEYEIPTWEEYLSNNYRDLSGLTRISIAMSPVEAGSLKWYQAFGITCSILATAPLAYKNSAEIYVPAAMRAIKAGSDYADVYIAGLAKSIDFDFIKQEPIEDDHQFRIILALPPREAETPD